MPRRLTDLYVVGKEVVLSDDQGDIVVWIQKLNPIQQEQAFSRANAERAKVLSVRRLPSDHEDRLPYEAEADSIADDRDMMIELLAAEEIHRARQSVESELAHEEEWEKDGYLDGLREAWENGAKERYHYGDIEAVRVFNELKRFTDTVEELVQPHIKRIKKDYASKTDDALRKQVVDQLIERDADARWLNEYRRCQVWLSVREPTDHRQLYFKSREEVDLLEVPTLAALIREYTNLEVEPIEGKD